MSRRWMSSLFACTAILGTAAAAWAGERHVPGQYGSIQEAVNASVSGDVVVCAAGTYTEAVTAVKSNVTIRGSAGAVWDGRTGTDAVTCLTLTGNANVVTGFAFKNGIDHCVLTGSDVKVTQCTSVDAGGSFCVVEGVRSRVEKCRIDRPRGRGVRCKGDGGVVVDVDVIVCADIGIDVEGDDCVMRYCYVDRCEKGGYRRKGRNHDVRDCEARSSKEFGFRLEVEASVILDSYARDCGTAGGSGAGFLAIGSDNYLEFCDTYACKPHGHHWKGNRNWGYDNWCDYAEMDGFLCEGYDNRCEYSQARYCGRDGHRTDGNRNEYRYCDSYDNGDDGFDCDRGSDNYYRSCRGKYNDGAGCENGGTSTDVYACTFLYNSVDVGLDGTLGASFGTFSFNTYLSGSVFAILKLGLGL